MFDKQKYGNVEVSKCNVPPDERFFMVFREGKPACLVLGDSFCLLSDICDAYAEYCDFDRETITVHPVGFNVLLMKSLR